MSQLRPMRDANHLTCHMLSAQYACSQIINRPFLWYGDYRLAKEELCGAMMEASNPEEMIFVHACIVELRHQWVARSEGLKAAHKLLNKHKGFIPSEAQFFRGIKP